MNDDFISAVRAYVARASLGASTVRGRGNTGAAAAARSVLARLDLSPFATSNAAAFCSRLDELTDRVRRSRRPFLTWGLSRKCVNIFLRESFYNQYLCQKYQLGAAERLYEVPVDSLIAAWLRKEFGGEVPRWKGVASLTPEANAAYQAAATVAAKKLGLARIHLDAFVWGRPEANLRMNTQGDD